MWWGVFAALAGVSGNGKALADPGLKLTPSIGWQESYSQSSNGLQNRTTTSTTAISPGLTIDGETATTVVNFAYQPSLTIFNDGSEPMRVDQNLNSLATTKLLDDRLTIKTTAYATQAGATPNSINNNGVLLPADNRVLLFIARVEPHFQTNFAGVAVLDAYYRINSTNVSDESTKIIGRPSVSSNSLDQNPELSISSTDLLGRVGVTLDFNYDSSNGSGLNTSSTLINATASTNYRINRAYEVYGSIGYQKTDYPADGTQKGFYNEGQTWGLGFSYTPNAISSASIGYGYSQGSYNPSVQVGYQLGARTRLVASYIVTVRNQQQTTLQNMSFISYDPFGNAIDSRTGLPFKATNGTFGSENVLFRDKPAELTIVHEFVRSSLSASLTYESRRSLSELNEGDRAWGISLGYSRQFTPMLDASFNLSYTKHRSSANGAPTESTDNVQISGSLLYRLSETMTFNLTETYFDVSSNLPGNDSDIEQLTVGVSRSF